MLNKINKRLRAVFGFSLAVFAVFFCLNLSTAHAAVLSVSPSGGTFTVGSTFDVSIFINSEGKAINAVAGSLSFPPDKLQLVSPSTGKSLIGVWTAQPNVNNQTGRLDLEGGIPGGINVSSGLVTTLTFRVKSVGTAVIKFLDNSKVLLNDGKGTNDLNNTNNGVYSLVLPAPAGPQVTSPTHPDQTIWYNNPNAILSWAVEDPVEGFSYQIDEQPVSTPDDISENKNNTVTYRNLSDGIHYFHIKALRQGTWGGTTHYALKIDTTPPAAFPIEILPYPRTSRQQPIIEFSTTDSGSGIDHYELALVPLSNTAIKPAGQKNQALFIEATSPYIPESLTKGNYDVIIRAYDLAGNIQEIKQQLSIVSPGFEIVQKNGLQFFGHIMPWWLILLLLLLMILLLWYLGRRIKNWHHDIDKKRADKIVPDVVIQQLEELAQYRKKYGKMMLVVLAVCSAVLFFGKTQTTIYAAENELPPPVITTLSTDITNQDIFYIGGQTESSNTDVIIHLQNLQTGETLGSQVTSGKKGDWFYRHDGFLTSGAYIIWVQSKIGEQFSTPSPQRQISVRQTALQFGSSRLSYESLYLISSCILLGIILLMLWYIIHHARHGRKKHKLFLQEVRQAEESIRRGFAVIKRDLEAELNTIHKLKLKGELSVEEQMHEQQLLKDIEDIEARVGKEIWELESLEN